MRKNRPSRRSGRNAFTRLFTGAGQSGVVRKAPRRRDVERLEGREMMTATPGTNEYFGTQWYLYANGQVTEFDPTSPTINQTLAVAGEDINVLRAWSQGATGAGTQVAIIDGGFDLTHEDLVYITSGLTTQLDLLDGDNDPSATDISDFLGTALAGVVGARDNAVGIVGVAHGADIFPVRLTPGAGDTATTTIDAINAAFRFQAGFIQDSNGDGVPDALLGGELVPFDVDGDGIADGLAQNPNLVTDVFLHTGGFQIIGASNLQPRTALALPTGASLDGRTISILESIKDTAIGGRATWVDDNGDGLMTASEIKSLGSIHIVPAGNSGAGGRSTPPFDERNVGTYSSSQYDQLANSIYTIAVGAVDSDGKFENPATGVITTYSEGGTNVLIVAPSGNFGNDISTNPTLNSGIVTTDPTGEAGRNVGPIFNFEYDGDYFGNTNYTSVASGTEYAAAQVAGVVSLMLEMNPRLSYRDVQQILLMSARQNDQFDESWIVNQMQEFRDFEPPQWASYEVDTDGDGEADETAILPNSEYIAGLRFPNDDYVPGLNDFLVERGFFLNENANIDPGLPFVFAPMPATTIDPDTLVESPVYFLDANGDIALDVYGYPIPRFADADGNLLGLAVIDPTTGVAMEIANDFYGGSTPPDARPIVQKFMQTYISSPPDVDPPVTAMREVISLLYDPNGNLFRPQAQALDDEGRLAFVDEARTIPLYQPAPVRQGDLDLRGGGLVIAPPTVGVSGNPTPNPVIIFAPDSVPTRPGIFAIQQPIIGRELMTDLLFENGAGFTVSHGYGSYLEDISYGHGVLDAGLAVKLAIAWDTYDLYLDESITLTSGVLGAGATFRIQPAVNINAPNGGGVILTVPGGIAGDTQNINAGYYEEFFKEYGTVDIDSGDVTVGEIITEAPFFNLDEDPVSDRGVTEIPFSFDPSTLTDFMSVEWLEFTTNIAAGDVDNLRLAIRSPDGTVSELSAFRPDAGTAFNPENPQGQQGRFTPFEQSISPEFGGIPLTGGGGFIGNTVQQQTGGITLDDALPNAQGWTWTTNRHWGELFSTLAQDTTTGGSNGGASLTDGWTLIVENHGFSEIRIGGQIEFTVHGTKATGNRIQGKVGIDDNKQGIVGTENDENFNFNRYLDLGVMNIQLTDADGNVFNRQQTVVLDDPNDSVTYTNSNTPAPGQPSLNNVYKTVAPETGIELFYPVINKDLYFDIRDPADPQATRGPIVESLEAFFRTTQHDDSLTITNIELVTAYDRHISPTDDLVVDQAVDLGFYGTLPVDFRADPLSYRNFDYSQENFAGGVTVSSTQYVTQRDIDGNIVDRTATGSVKYFTTGADGNYYFDVLATPEAPQEDDFVSNGQYWAAYYQWFADYGGLTYDYEIAVVGDDVDRLITNGGAGYFDTPEAASSHGSTVAFDGTSKYTVEIFASPLLRNGQTSKVTNVNFLLEIDPALTNVPVTGTVFRDRNNDGVQQPGIDESAAGVTVFIDANGNSTLDAGEVSAVTDANGNYSLVVTGLLSPTSVTIGVDASTIPAGLVTQNPLSGFRSVTVTPGQAVDVDFTLRLGVGEPAIAVGTVFEDANQNGVRDAGEGPFTDSVQVNGQDVFISAYVDINGDGLYDPSEPSATVRQDGTFLIETSATGTYNVRLNLPSTQLKQTRPTNGAGVAVNLVAGQQSTLSSQFGVYDGRIFDFGDLYVDANHNYPTLLANNGARHVVIPGVRLGMGNDVDSDGFQSAVRNPAIDGLGDDYNGIDDEDGVRLVSTTITPGGTIQFDIMAFGAGAVLNAWFDFNNDGDWDDAGEKIFNNVEDMQVLDPLNPKFRRFTVAVPANVATSATFYAARFRWGSAGLGYAGVANSGEVEDYLFAATTPIVVSGNVRNDINGDGVFQPSDPAVPGVRVYFDRNLNGMLDADEPRSITDAGGAYRIEIPATTAQNVTLRLDTSTVPVGLGPLVPIGGIFNQTIAPSTAVTSNFLVGAPQGLTGVVFSDLDNDGVRDSGEGGFANVVVEVFRDADNNGSFETLVQTTTTNAQGAYTVPVTSVGQYQVRVNLGTQQFVTQTTPGNNAGRTVSVLSGAFATVGDFGLHDAVPTFTLDYGDLIVGGGLNYPTRLTDNGARHTIVSGSYLGTVRPDADPGTLQSVNAQADDTLFSPDDEDGVVMRSDIAPNSVVLIDVTATGSAGDRLHAWIDFNNDGDWDDAGERITDPAGLGLTSGQTTQLVINTTGIVVDGSAASFAARFRWGQGITGYTGLASTGEVEDYRLSRSLTTSGALVDGDFNGDGQVTLADRAIWRAAYGSTTNLAADGNRDGVVNSADYALWRDAFDASIVSPPLIVAGSQPDEYAYLNPFAVPALLTMPIVEDVLEPAVYDANAFAPMFLMNPKVTSVLDESLAIEEEAVDSDNAFDAALLQWALGSAAADEQAPSVYSHEEAEQVEAEEFEEAFASAFAF